MSAITRRGGDGGPAPLPSESLDKACNRYASRFGDALRITLRNCERALAADQGAE